jgi:excisionase family DNA binding protein
MDQQVVLLPVPLDKILEAVRGIVNDVLDSRESKDDRLYTRKETAEKFGISLVTLHQWTINGLIEAYRVGGRVYYKEQAVESALKKISKYTPGNAA